MKQPAHRRQRYDLIVISCRPAERPTHPEAAAAWDLLAPLDGYEQEQCQLCQRAVLIGARQLIERRRRPGNSVITACTYCSTDLATAPDVDAEYRDLGNPP